MLNFVPKSIVVVPTVMLMKLFEIGFSGGPLVLSPPPTVPVELLSADLFHKKSDAHMM